MPMTQAVLATQLQGMTPVSSEPAAIATLANAYAVFAADAVAGAAPITAAGIALGKAAMSTALVGMSSAGAGAGKLVTAVQAFWVAVAGGLATSFAGATAIVPPPNAGLLALLTATFAANTSTSADLATATNAVATNLRDQAIIGGTVTFPGPVVSPIT